MRKIEQRMVEAVRFLFPFQESNTTVTIDFNTAHVFLHGNHIASVVNGEPIVNIETLRTYPTNTTKSRLRALGVDVSTNNFVTYLNGKAI